MSLLLKPLTLTQSAGRRLKATATAVRAGPYILAIPLLLFALMVALGIWATIAGAAGDAAAARVAANSQLNVVCASLELTFAQSVVPVRSLANLVQQVPDYDTVIKMWSTWVPTFYSWVRGNELADRGSSLTLMPAGRVTAVYPPSAANNTVMGLDILLPGPFIASGTKLLAVTVPIMMRNVNANETWGIPWGGDLLDKCPECYNNATRTKWWGFAALSLSLDSALEDSAGTKLVSLLDGLHYRLSAPTLASAAEDRAYSTLYESTDKPMASDSLCRDVLVLEDKVRQGQTKCHITAST
ncbi:phosphodiesterase [Haematococcus lacustris]|uniref:Phosphodiesterase n=1 Tax=Haematococcus lacustris TaxID=44745 RepID=A0A6A0A7S4_HAELA|nr:phosphodiesterase [Haematococcus lacustris]